MSSISQETTTEAGAGARAPVRLAVNREVRHQCDTPASFFSLFHHCCPLVSPTHTSFFVLSLLLLSLVHTGSGKGGRTSASALASASSAASSSSSSSARHDKGSSKKGSGSDNAAGTSSANNTGRGRGGHNNNTNNTNNNSETSDSSRDGKKKRSPPPHNAYNAPASIGGSGKLVRHTHAREHEHEYHD